MDYVVEDGEAWWLKFDHARGRCGWSCATVQWRKDVAKGGCLRWGQVVAVVMAPGVGEVAMALKVM